MSLIRHFSSIGSSIGYGLHLRHRAQPVSLELLPERDAATWSPHAPQPAINHVDRRLGHRDLGPRLVGQGVVAHPQLWSHGDPGGKSGGYSCTLLVFIDDATGRNKGLGAALAWAQERQRARDEDRLANPKPTLREKAWIREKVPAEKRMQG